MSKCESIDTGIDRRYVDRKERGKLQQDHDISHSVSDGRHGAKYNAEPGQDNRKH